LQYDYLNATTADSSCYMELCCAGSLGLRELAERNTDSISFDVNMTHWN